MTKEEAIKELSVLWEGMKRAKEIGVLAYKTIMFYDGQYVESLDLAIKALEQQPSEDCISRKAVKELLKTEWVKYHMPIELDVNLSFVLSKINELPSVTPKAEWIPISEKPTEGKYLVTGQYRKIRYVDIATFDGEDAEDTYSWDSYSDEYKIERRKHKVIAYMPLPKPYKAESEE